VKTSILVIAMLGLASFTWADDLDDAYAQMKDAQEKKDADAVKKWAGEVSKAARAEAARAKPADTTDAAWKERVDFAKEADTLSEYDLATTAAQPGLAPAKTVELVDALLAQNPKTQYIGACASAYLAALDKQSPGKSLDGAAKIINGNPNNEDALFALVSGYQSKAPDKALTYANRRCRWCALRPNRKACRTAIGTSRRAICWPAATITREYFPPRVRGRRSRIATRTCARDCPTSPSRLEWPELPITTWAFAITTSAN
jgi:hypothetical protein